MFCGAHRAQPGACSPPELLRAIGMPSGSPKELSGGAAGRESARQGQSAVSKARSPGPQPEPSAPAAGLPDSLIDAVCTYDDDVCHGTATVARLVLGQVR